MPRKTTPKLSEAMDQFLLIRSISNATSTIENDRSVLRRFVQGVSDPYVHLLTPEDVEIWFAQEANRQQASSFNKVQQRVRLFVTFCVERRWLDHNPMSQIRPRRVPEKDRMRLSPVQLRAIVEKTVNPRDRGMIALAVNTGLRASDIVSMRVGDVDLVAGEIRIRVQKTQRLDSLPITAELDLELRRWLSYYSERMVLEDDFLLFPSTGSADQFKKYGDPLPHQKLTKPAQVVQRGLLRIGIEETVNQGFHLIRRSVARTFYDSLVADGYDSALKVTASLLGHKNIATTEMYLGVSLDRQKRNELLRGKSLLGVVPENVVSIAQ